MDQIAYVGKSSIKVSRFVTDETAGGLVGPKVIKQAVDGDSPVIGVSTQHSSDPEYPEKKEQFEAGVVAAGGTVGSSDATTYTPLACPGTSTVPRECMVYGRPGQECGLKINATIALGDLLMPDANGLGIVATTGKYYGARALQAGVAGETINVEITRGQLA